MFTQRRTYLEKAFLSAVTVLLLLTTDGQSAVLSNSPQTSTAPPVSNSSLTTQITGNMEEPRVQRIHRSCGSEHSTYCGNGGQCMLPQDSEKPSCICTSSYSGPRCMHFSDRTYTPPELEEVIAISFGVIMVIFLVLIVIYCCAYKRCVKSAPLIKSASSETSV
ncbi:epigen [Leuresthes tenuis]|uniref:epigen n=1 Tax=Leuresthes tenuis TaxID=355514 RepID=UPI003B51096F